MKQLLEGALSVFPGKYTGRPSRLNLLRVVKSRNIIFLEKRVPHFRTERGLIEMFGPCEKPFLIPLFKNVPGTENQQRRYLPLYL